MFLLFSLLCSSYDFGDKIASGQNEFIVYTPMNKPPSLSKQMYFKRMSLLNPNADEESEKEEDEEGGESKTAPREDRRPLTAFPSTLVGCLNQVYHVYLINLNWNKRANSVFSTQRANDVTKAFVQQIIAHFKLKVVASVLETATAP